MVVRADKFENRYTGARVVITYLMLAYKWHMAPRYFPQYVLQRRSAHLPVLRLSPSFSRSCISQVLHFQSPVKNVGLYMGLVEYLSMNMTSIT